MAGFFYARYTPPSMFADLVKERWGASGRKEGNTPMHPAGKHNTATVPMRTYVRV